MDQSWILLDQQQAHLLIIPVNSEGSWEKLWDIHFQESL